MTIVWKDKKAASFISTQCDVRGDETVRESRRMERTSKFQRSLPLPFTTSTWGSRSQGPNVPVLRDLKASKEVVALTVLLLLIGEYC